MLWGLSLASARRHFEKLLIVTDVKGMSLMKHFPYDIFDDRLESGIVPEAAEKVWCAGKLKAYQIACRLARDLHTGFCHFDGDVVMRKFPYVCGASLFAQSDEPFNSPAGEAFEIFLHDCYVGGGCQRMPRLPGHVRFSLTRGQQSAYNVGIVGGTDLDFLERWAFESLKVLNHDLNQSHISAIWPGTAACFVEQYLFASLARHEGKYVSILFPSQAACNEDFMDQIGYIHLLADSKHHPIMISQVESVLKKEFPWMWEIVDSLGLPKEDPLQSNCSNSSRSYLYSPRSVSIASSCDGPAHPRGVGTLIRQ